MMHEDLFGALKASGIPFTYHHWESPPSLPYGVYLETYSNNFSADGVVYHTVSHYQVELYLSEKDPEPAAKVEAVLTKAGIFYNKDEQYLPDVRLYQIIYEIEV